MATFDAYIGWKDVQAVQIRIIHTPTNTVTEEYMEADAELDSVWYVELAVSEQDIKNGYLYYKYVVTKKAGLFRSEETQEEIKLRKLQRCLNVDMVYDTSQQKLPVFVAGVKCLLEGVFFPSIGEDNCALLENCMSDIFHALSVYNVRNSQIKEFFNVVKDLLLKNEPTPYQNYFILFCIRRFSFLAKVPEYELIKYLDKQILQKVLSNLYLLKTDGQACLDKDNLRFGVASMLLATEKFWDALSVLVILYPALQVEDIERQGACWYSRDDTSYLNAVQPLVKRAKQMGNISEHLYLFEKLISRSSTVSLALKAYTHIYDSTTDLSAKEQMTLGDAIIRHFKETIKENGQYSLAHLLHLGDDVRKVNVPFVKATLLPYIISVSWLKMKSSQYVSEDLFSRFLNQINELLHIAFDDNKNFVTKILQTVSTLQRFSEHFGNFVKYSFIRDVVEQLEPKVQNDMFFKWLKNLLLSPEISYSRNRRLNYLKVIFKGTAAVVQNTRIDGNMFHAICGTVKEICNSYKFTVKELLSIPASFDISEPLKCVYNECISGALEGKVLKEMSTLQLIFDSWKSFENKPEARL